MPYVNIKIAGTATKEQKEKLYEGVTGLMKDVLDKAPDSTYVVIDEVDTDNWGVGGQSLTERRKGK